MSEQSEREWKSYLLSKGVFGNALRFAHLEKPEEVDRTPLGGSRWWLQFYVPLVTLTSISGTKFVCRMCTLTIVSSGEKPALDI